MAYLEEPAIDEVADRDLLCGYAVDRYCPPSGRQHFALIGQTG